MHPISMRAAAAAHGRRPTSCALTYCVLLLLCCQHQPARIGVKALKLTFDLRRQGTANDKSGARNTFFKTSYRKLDSEDEGVWKLWNSNATVALTEKPAQREQRFWWQRQQDSSCIGVDQATKSPLFRTAAVPINMPATTATDNSKITHVHQLRQKVLDQGIPFKKLSIGPDIYQPAAVDDELSLLQNHTVIQLIVDRFHSGSTPGHRAANDTARLALCMEGGGMRGAVSAGMASCLAAFGLCDTLDVIYGSSAGSVIGAYMVSRQMVCMDVYVDILPAAKSSFVCLWRLLHSILATSLHGLAQQQSLLRRLSKFSSHGVAPGMNISFVLDGIMDEKYGVRPLDLETFRANNEIQPLRVASSYVKNGQLHTRSFGTSDFFPNDDANDKKQKKTSDDRTRNDKASTTRRKNHQQALFDCLRASMTVPGATGPPVQIQDKDSQTLPFFDAFCFEPIPYRSAVEEGATHCLVFCSRPHDFLPKSKPSAYEKAVAPLYFQSHGEPQVAEFFKAGGQQYIYAEDLMTLEEGKHQGLHHDSAQAPAGRVQVPPPTVLYGVDRDADRERLARQRKDWKSAHLFPLKVPVGTPELATLEQDRDTVREGVRGGFASAFDLLAPAIGLELEPPMTGTAVAKLLFPDDDDTLFSPNTSSVLEQRLYVRGERIKHQNHHGGLPEGQRKLQELKQTIQSLRSKEKGRDAAVSDTTKFLSPFLGKEDQDKTAATSATASTNNMSDEDQYRELLLEKLPGFRAGRMSHLAESLRVSNSTVAVR